MIIPVSCNVIFSDCLVHRFINSFLYSYSVLPVMFLFLFCLCLRLVLALVSVIVISFFFIVIVSHPVCIMSSFVSLVRFCQLCSPCVHSALISSHVFELSVSFCSLLHSPSKYEFLVGLKDRLSLFLTGIILYFVLVYSSCFRLVLGSSSVSRTASPNTQHTVLFYLFFSAG